MFGRPKPPPSAVPEHIRRRARRLPSSDLMLWADQSIYTAGRYLTLYQRSGSEQDLDEAITAAQVLLAIMDALSSQETS